MSGECHDCGCKEGELHNYFPNCDMEICPECKGQLFICGCNPFDKHSREPYFKEISNCLRCGKSSPDFKMVSKEEWKFICGISYPLDCILCKECMKFIKKKRDLLE